MAQTETNRGKAQRLPGAPIEKVPVPGIASDLRQRALGTQVRAPALHTTPIQALAQQRSGQLQQAQAQRYAQTRPAGQTGSRPTQFAGTSPLASSILKAKKLSLAAQLGGRDLGELKDQVQDVLEDPNISVQEFEHLLGPIVKQQQEAPARTIHGGSVRFSQGTGPNAMSPEDFAAGQQRQQEGLQAGETLTPDAQGYTVKEADHIQQPLAGGKPPVVKPETAYQRSQLTDLEAGVRKAEGVEGKAQKAVDVAGATTKHWFSPDTATKEAYQQVEAQMAGDHARAQLNAAQLQLPGSPDRQPPQAAAPVSAPAPQQPVGRMTPMKPQAWPRPPEQGGPPPHPVTGIPVVQNQQHLDNVPPGEIVHLPDGRMVRKIGPKPEAPVEGAGAYGSEPDPTLQ